MTDRMKWWAVIGMKSNKVEFIKRTFAQVCRMYDACELYDYVVVRPEHKMFPKAYRDYNERRSMDYINAMHKANIEKLIEMKAPQVVIDQADGIGPFCLDPSDFLEHSCGNLKKMAMHPKNAARLKDDARVAELTRIIGENASLQDLTLANVIY